MARGGRARLRAQASILRQAGEIVTLLISAHQSVADDRSTAFDAVAEQSPAPQAQDKKVSLYARVSYHKYRDISADQGGRVSQTLATVELSAEYADRAAQCYAVQLANGAILKKTSEQWSEGREQYLLECSSYMNEVM